MKMSEAAREGLLKIIKSLESEFTGMVPALLWVEDRTPRKKGDPKSPANRGPMLGVYTPEQFTKITHQDCFLVGDYKIYIVFWPDFYEKHKDWVIDIVNGDLGLVSPKN